MTTPQTLTVAARDILPGDQIQPQPWPKGTQYGTGTVARVDTKPSPTGPYGSMRTLLTMRVGQAPIVCPADTELTVLRGVEPEPEHARRAYRVGERVEHLVVGAEDGTLWMLREGSMEGLRWRNRIPFRGLVASLKPVDPRDAKHADLPFSLRA